MTRISYENHFYGNYSYGNSAYGKSASGRCTYGAHASDNDFYGNHASNDRSDNISCLGKYKTVMSKFQTAFPSKPECISAKTAPSFPSRPVLSDSSSAIAELTRTFRLTTPGKPANESNISRFGASRSSDASGKFESSFSAQPPGGASNTKWLGYSIETEKDVSCDSWDKVDEVPGYYELKDGKAIAWIGMYDDLEFRFFHAADSTNENPILIARGADSLGRVFEQRIDVNKINPYNATHMEINAFTQCYSSEYKDISIPFSDFYDSQDLDDRFDFINGLQHAILVNLKQGFVQSARQYQEDIDFLLNAITNHTALACTEHNK